MGFLKLDSTSRHVTRLNFRTGTEGLSVCSLNCDRPLRSGIRASETVMSTGGQITDSVRPCTATVTVAPECDLAGWADRL